MASLAELARRLKPPVAVARQLPALPALLLMTDRRRLPDPLPALRRLPRGAAVVLRDDWAREAGLARRVAAIARERRLRVLVAGNWRLAAAIGADGLHLPEWFARQGGRAWVPMARRRRWLVTAAAHAPAAIHRAARLGCDAVLLAAVFPTASHPGRPALGVLRFARFARLAPVPVYALGGITPATARRLAGTAAVGFAAIGALADNSTRAASPVSPARGMAG
jgi:thiamine-phosphate pyrophosphorylase